MPLRDSTEAELDAFDDVCRRLGGFNLRIDPEWADGYLTAVAAGPRAVPIDEWLPRLADDAFDRAFGDPPSAAQARAALQARMRVIVQHLDPEALLDQPDALRLQPRVTSWDEADPAQDWVPPPGGSLWAAGFFDAIEDFAGDWSAATPLDADAAAERDELLQEVRWLQRADDDPALQAHVRTASPDGLGTRTDLVDQAAYAVQDLRCWWLDHAPRPTTRHVEPVPGRNDPCPCGSGLKYKKCHGKGS